jgi:hypothetical protein
MKVLMDYHCHITIPAFNKTPIKGWKETTILLSDNTKEVEDLMYTRHFKIGSHGIASEEDIFKECMATARDCGGIRVKVEKESGFENEVLTPSRYMEHHLLIIGDSATLNESWRRSRNPKRLEKNGQRSYFYTKRSRSGSVSESLLEVLLDTEGLSRFSIKEAKHELVVLDTNPGHDSWWA